MNRRSARTKVSFLSRRFQLQANQNAHEDRIPDTLALDTLAPLASDTARFDDLVARVDSIVKQRDEIYVHRSAKGGIDIFDYPQSTAMKSILRRMSKRAPAKNNASKVQKARRQAANLEKVLERATSKQQEAAQESEDDAEEEEDDAIKRSSKKRRAIESGSESGEDAKPDFGDDDADDGHSKKEDEGEAAQNPAAKKQRTGDEELSDDMASLASSDMSETAGDYGLNYVDEEYSELDDGDNDYAGDY